MFNKKTEPTEFVFMKLRLEFHLQTYALIQLVQPLNKRLIIMITQNEDKKNKTIENVNILYGVLA